MQIKQKPYNMKQVTTINKFGAYDAPKADVLEISSEGVLCESESEGFGMDSMDVIEGDNNPWGWEN